MSSSLFSWPIEVYRADFEAVYRANGMDAYFFVRFLRLMAIIFLPIWFVTWPLLLPLTSVGTNTPGHSGLDKYSFGNIDFNHASRYWAHVVVAYLITGEYFEHQSSMYCINVTCNSLGVL
jgi:hypothetical protein